MSTRNTALNQSCSRTHDLLLLLLNARNADVSSFDVNVNIKCVTILNLAPVLI